MDALQRASDGIAGQAKRNQRPKINCYTLSACQVTKATLLYVHVSLSDQFMRVRPAWARCQTETKVVFAAMAINQVRTVVA